MVLENINEQGETINKFPLYPYVTVIDNKDKTHSVNEHGYTDTSKDDDEDDDDDFCENYSINIDTKPIYDWIKSINYVPSEKTTVKIGDDTYEINKEYYLD